MARAFFPLASLLYVLLFSFGFTSSPKEPKTVVFLGDSITNRGLRAGGYISLLKEELSKKGKLNEYTFIGAGHEGNTVLNLKARVDRDVVAKKPDIVFIYIGINDVWKSISNPPANTPIDAYEAGLKEIICKIKATGAKVVLCTPSVIGEKTNGGNPQDAMLDRYAQVSREVAKSTNSKLCDLRKAFVAYLDKHNPEDKEKGILTHDRVHLSDAGNQLVAKQMLKYLR